GPIETASQEMLEALYHQARDSYYSGQPLIVDDMFDKVELKLRVYGSPSVVKYPRCSLKRQSTYADAEGRRTNQCSWHSQASGCCCSCLAHRHFSFPLSVF
ncbi:Os05g0110800, partial [Oryza sativa Japonica Group]